MGSLGNFGLDAILAELKKLMSSGSAGTHKPN